MNEIGSKIRETMMRENVWVSELARATGMFKNNIHVILGPRGNPTWATVKRILDALKLEVVLRKKD